MPDSLATLTLPLFESIPDALLIVDGSGSIVRANGNAHALFGYPPGALAGLAVEQLVPTDARERHRAHRTGYMGNPRVRPMGMANMTLSGQRFDGQQFPVEIALSPVETQHGLYFLASVRDISETQRVRQALTRARYDIVVARIGQLALASTTEERLARQIPQLLAEVLDVPLVAIVVVEDGGPVLRAAVGVDDDGNEAPPWLAVTRGPLRAALAAEVAILDPRDAAAGDWPEGARSGAAVPLLDRGTPTGALIAVSPDPARFDHDSLQLLQTVGNLLSTLVQRRHYEEQLAHAQRLDAIGQLTGGVAHDFNNLLTVISGNLQLLEDECAALPNAREIINSALRSVGRGAELTGKLLAFARRQHLSPTALDPAAILGDLRLMLRSTLGDGIEVRIEHPDALPPMFADASQLDSALLNLALNARDAMPGGGRIDITASERWIIADAAHPARQPGHYVAFRVSDRGCGMAPEVLARAFEPFFTTKGLGRGSGLGLSMVYGFVRQSGGFLEIESRQSEGTTVEMFLPVAGPDMVEPVASAPRVGGDIDRRPTIMVVEDEEDVRRIAKAFLESLDYKVVAVANAAEALGLLEAGMPGISLLFTDVMLGTGMNGVELALAAREAREGLGVLLTSGYEASSVSMAEGAGFELLRKPYRREQLEAAVRRNLPVVAPPG